MLIDASLHYHPLVTSPSCRYLRFIMVRILGPLHTDSAAGTVGGITHRRYRGSNIASGVRSKTRVRPKITSINDPMSIPGCVGWWNLGRGVTLTPPPPPLKVLSILDNTFKSGPFEQSSAGIAPTYHAADPLHNNRPYCEFDGVNDRMFTPLTQPTFPQPFELWIVCNNLSPTNITARIISTHDGVEYYFWRSTTSPHPWRINFGVSLFVIQPHPPAVHLYRIVVDGVSSFGELDGVPQYPPGNAGTQPLRRMLLAASWGLIEFTNLQLFDFSLFSRILNPVQRQLLINWYFKWFNLP